LRLARVKAASFEIFSSLAVNEPEEIKLIKRSMQRYYEAILTLSEVVVSLSEIVQRISKQPSLVSIFGLTSKLTKL
jgi:hypothetical protein